MTFIETAESKVDPAWKLDGKSFLPLLDGTPKATTAAPRSLYWRKGGSEGPRAMREGKWKLVHDRKTGNAPALFDLEKDIGETTDISKEHPGTLKAMLQKLDTWESQLEEPRWGAGKAK